MAHKDTFSFVECKHYPSEHGKKLTLKDQSPFMLGKRKNNARDGGFQRVERRASGPIWNSMIHKGPFGSLSEELLCVVPLLIYFHTRHTFCPTGHCCLHHCMPHPHDCHRSKLLKYLLHHLLYSENNRRNILF